MEYFNLSWNVQNPAHICHDAPLPPPSMLPANPSSQARQMERAHMHADGTRSLEPPKSTIRGVISGAIVSWIRDSLGTKVMKLCECVHHKLIRRQMRIGRLDAVQFTVDPVCSPLIDLATYITIHAGTPQKDFWLHGTMVGLFVLHLPRNSEKNPRTEWDSISGWVRALVALGTERWKEW